MAIFEVVKKCVLSLEDGTKHVFEVGMHEVEDFIARHWFFRVHTREGLAEAANAPTDPTAGTVVVRKPLATVTQPVASEPAPAVEEPAPEGPAPADTPKGKASK